MLLFSAFVIAFAALQADANVDPENILGGGWILVRRVQAGNKWHPATDQLLGTDVYGSYVSDPTADATFSTAFDINRVAEFLFATGDGEKWLVASKDSVVGDFYANELRPITASSESETGGSSRWYRRQGVREDPWISLIDHHHAIGAGDILYGGASFGGTHANAVLPHHNGANVFVRYKPAECITARVGGIQDQEGRQDHHGVDSDEHCQSACDGRSDCAYWMRAGANCYTYSSGTIDETSSWALRHRYGEQCKSSSSCSYSQTNGQNCYNYARITVDGFRGNDVTVETCQSLCTNHDDCVKINYYVGGICTRCGVPSRCYLISSAANSGCHWSSSSTADTYTKGACVTTPEKYVQVYGEGTCETLGGYETIMDSDTCEEAAVFLGKQDTTVSVHAKHGRASNRPAGCTYHQFQNLELWTQSTGVCTFGRGCLCLNPSIHPTQIRTTSEPTPSPTSQPTLDPTRAPSKSPTTSEPTPSPTSQPTVDPTRAPSKSPTPTPLSTIMPISCSSTNIYANNPNYHCSKAYPGVPGQFKFQHLWNGDIDFEFDGFYDIHKITWTNPSASWTWNNVVKFQMTFSDGTVLEEDSLGADVTVREFSPVVKGVKSVKITILKGSHGGGGDWGAKEIKFEGIPVETYVKASKGEDCPSGYSFIDDLEQCESALGALGGINGLPSSNAGHTIGNWAHHFKGCFLKTSNNYVHFNVNDGTIDRDSQRYCIANVMIPPTSSPTQSPTTSEPTPSPTSQPTVDPTRAPSRNPSKAPTNGPTPSPTSAPTVDPTQAPSKAPTNGPTPSPTSAPTVDPTRAPSKAPTNGPTPSPTTQPTVDPTVTPSHSPSKSPTSNPTTDSPSKTPSTSPTANPSTSSPSTSPTAGDFILKVQGYAGDPQNFVDWDMANQDQPRMKAFQFDFIRQLKHARKPCGADSWLPTWGKSAKESCAAWFTDSEWGVNRNCEKCNAGTFGRNECAGTCCAHCGQVDQRKL